MDDAEDFFGDDVGFGGVVHVLFDGFFGVFDGGEVVGVVGVFDETHGFVKGCADVAGLEVDDVDGVVVAEFEAKGLGEGAEGGFGGVVRAHEGNGEARGEGADVDDGAAVGAQVWDGEFDELQRPKNKDLHLFVPDVEGDIFQRAEGAAAGVVDEDVDFSGLF